MPPPSPHTRTRGLAPHAHMPVSGMCLRLRSSRAKRVPRYAVAGEVSPDPSRPRLSPCGAHLANSPRRPPPDSPPLRTPLIIAGIHAGGGLGRRLSGRNTGLAAPLGGVWAALARQPPFGASVRCMAPGGASSGVAGGGSFLARPRYTLISAYRGLPQCGARRKAPCPATTAPRKRRRGRPRCGNPAGLWPARRGLRRRGGGSFLTRPRPALPRRAAIHSGWRVNR